MKKILIFGASGMLGKAVVKELSDNDDYKLIMPSSKFISLESFSEVYNLILGTRPDIVINCGAMTDVDACEVDFTKCCDINAWALVSIRDACNIVGGKIIHISTDYVFDGNTDIPYDEDAFVNPINHYGCSKLASERYLGRYKDHVIIRTSWLYGYGRTNYIDNIVKNILLEKQCYGVTDQIGDPTSCVDVANAIHKIIEDDSIQGIVHVTSQAAVSRYEVVEEIARLLKKNIVIKPVSLDTLNYKAKRPKYTSLYSSIDFGIPDWKESLKTYMEVKGWIEY